MVVKIASYSNGGYNTEVEETEWIDYRIIARLNEEAESIITLADPTGALMQKYNVNLSKALAGGVADDGGVETDETTETNSAAANDMTLIPAVPVINDAYYFGFDEQVNSFSLNVGTAAVRAGASYLITWEYSQGADAWAALAGVTDNTDSYVNAGINSVIWTIPGDWATDEVGSISAKYWVRGRLSAQDAPPTTIPIGTQAWYNTIYIGPGRLTIENPASTDIFDGRILKALFNQGSSTVQLMCKDWLSQLDDPIITYDMREDLDGNGLREGEAHSDPNGAFVDVAENDAGTFYFYDDGEYDDAGGMSWVADQFNGMRLVLSSAMAGKKTWRFFPYDATATGADVYGDDPHLLWTDDGNVDVGFADNDWTLDYAFRVYLGHDTPSDFYVHSSITGARVHTLYQVSGVGNHSHIQIDDKTDGWIEFDILAVSDHFTRTTYTVLVDDLALIIDANGIATIRFDVDRTGGNATLSVGFLYLEVDVETTGYSGAITINDTFAPNKLEIAIDLTAAATRIWEKIPYAIVQEVYKHIDTAEGGTLVSDYDVLVPLTAAANIEHTSGFSTRRYENNTPLAIIQDLANIDKTAFYIPIGTTALTWKSTFNDGAPTAMTDASVIRWGGEYSFVDVRNGYVLYGPKINDALLRLDTKDITGGDPGADSKSTYGISRYKVVKNAGVNTEYELSALGSALVERDEDVLLFLNCDIAGLSALRLGDEVSITSTYMNLTAAKYVITYWEYSYAQNITQLRLHPRLSTKGFVQHVLFSDSIRRLAGSTEQLSADIDYIPAETST